MRRRLALMLRALARRLDPDPVVDMLANYAYYRMPEHAESAVPSSLKGLMGYDDAATYHRTAISIDADAVAQ